MKKLSPKGTARAFTLIELIVIVCILVVLAVALVIISDKPRQITFRMTCTSNLKQVGLSFRTWAIDHSGNWPAPWAIDEGTWPQRVPTVIGGTEGLAATGQAFVHFRAISNELTTPKVLVCPADGAKTAAPDFGPQFSDKNVSYFVSIDADERNHDMLATGDRNLAFQGRPIKPGLFMLTTNNPALSWTKAIHTYRSQNHFAFSEGCGNVGLADGSVQGFNQQRLPKAAEHQGVASNRLVIP